MALQVIAVRCKNCRAIHYYNSSTSTDFMIASLQPRDRPPKRGSAFDSASRQPSPPTEVPGKRF